ncbi:ATPase [Methermicoccus shengliensis]|uniref:ATPase n=1 Tax=Methermicoccus shengliensis TaxID=660064 RepID=UPI0005B2B7C8|nr:ATPase [Methermicoccus shengliensis]MDN5294680.1 V/A-type H+/Na+-transporting ATPase subunit [Methanosarcinales archaeon]
MVAELTDWGMIAIGAGISMVGGCIGTGIAQGAIGSAGIGVVAEKPEKLGTVLFLMVIPETLLIFGFVVSLILLLRIFG